METTNQQQKPKSIKIFNKIDLTKAVKKAKETKELKPVVYKAKVKKSKNYVEEPVTIGQTDLLSIEEGSIRKYIDECHPEVKDFIHENHAETITAKCGQLIIVTRNKMRIVITTTGKFQRKVLITDKNKVVLFNDITEVKFKKNKDGII
jgi:hypothetical protein